LAQAQAIASTILRRGFCATLGHTPQSDPSRTPQPMASRSRPRARPGGRALVVLSASTLCAAALGPASAGLRRRTFQVAFTRPMFKLSRATPRDVRRVVNRAASSKGNLAAAAAELEEGFGAAASLGPRDVGMPSSVEVVSRIMCRWLAFLHRGQGGPASDALASPELLVDASGFPLEQALELFAEGGRQALTGAMVLTAGLPEGAPQALGPVGWIAAVRNGEDLDLGLLGGKEWHTLHLDLLAANPLLGWASGAAEGGQRLLRKLLRSAAACGRAVTVQPLSESLREQYRRLGFQEDALLDPTLMFWVPSDEGDSSVAPRETSLLAYG